jgi:hypothetical protein
VSVFGQVLGYSREGGSAPFPKRQAIYLLHEPVRVEVTPTTGNVGEFSNLGNPNPESEFRDRSGNPGGALGGSDPADDGAVSESVNGEMNRAEAAAGRRAEGVRGLELTASFNAQTLTVDVDALSWL